MLYFEIFMLILPWKIWDISIIFWVFRCPALLMVSLWVRNRTLQVSFIVSICSTASRPWLLSPPWWNYQCKGGGVPLNSKDATKYRSIVGTLQYIPLTRPDIAFLVNKIYQYLHSPTTLHWTIVKTILQFLKHIDSFGLHITRSSSTLLSAFSDVD
jgi:hypothetical protein